MNFEITSVDASLYRELLEQNQERNAQNTPKSDLGLAMINDLGELDAVSLNSSSNDVANSYNNIGAVPMINMRKLPMNYDTMPVNPGLEPVNPLPTPAIQDRQEMYDVKYSEAELKLLAGPKNKKGELRWYEHRAFVEFADTNGDGVLSDSEKAAAMKKLTGPNAKKYKAEYRKLANVNRAIYQQYLALDKSKGKNDDLKVSVNEFKAKYGAVLAKALDRNGDGTITHLEYAAMVKIYDKNGDGKLTAKDIQQARNQAKNHPKNFKMVLTSEVRKLAKHSKLRTQMMSGNFNTSPKDEALTIDKVLNNDGKITRNEHEAFVKFADKNNDGFMSESEKKAALKRLTSSDASTKAKAKKELLQDRKEVNAMYSQFKNAASNNKFLTPGEFKDFLVNKKGISPAAAEKLEKLIDDVLQTDNEISFNEFKAITAFVDNLSGSSDGKMTKKEIEKAIKALDVSGDLDRTDANKTLINTRRQARLLLKQNFNKTIFLDRGYEYSYLEARTPRHT